MPMPSASASRPLLVAALCAGLALPVSPQVQSYGSRAASPAVSIDGRSDDWTPLTLIRDARSGAAFAFRNDGRSLFILFIVNDAKVLESLASTGLTILAGAPGRKLERGVLFLKRPVSADAYIGWHESQGTDLTNEEKAKLRAAVQHDLCLAFAVGPKGSTYGPLRRLRDSEPPEFAAAEGPSGTIYEIKIPLAAPDLVAGGVGTAPGEAVRISFEWGGAARKIGGTKAIRETPPSEAGGLFGVATPAQEFLNMFDPMTRPSTNTKKHSVAVDVTLAGSK
jgi:hypothetical protein